MGDRRWLHSYSFTIVLVVLGDQNLSLTSFYLFWIDWLVRDSHERNTIIRVSYFLGFDWLVMCGFANALINWMKLLGFVFYSLAAWSASECNPFSGFGWYLLVLYQMYVWIRGFWREWWLGFTLLCGDRWCSAAVVVVCVWWSTAFWNVRVFKP